MKFKFSMVLACVMGIESIALFPSLTQAQPQTGMPQFPRPMERPDSSNHSGQRLMERPNLTKDQEDDLQEIQEDVRSQLEDVLSEDQEDDLQSAIEDRRDLREALASLDLDDDQRSRVQEILQDAQERMRSVFTSGSR